MKFYYAHPAPERFVSEVRAMAADGSLEPPPARIVTAAFLGAVMRSDPSQIRAWTDELADLRGAARETLQLAVWLSGTSEGRAALERAGADPRMQAAPPDLLGRKVDDPAVLDMLWAHYFATGDARAVRRVISALEHLSDYGAAATFKASRQTDADRARALNDALFQAASWSLTSLMTEHAPLVALCEQIFDGSDLTANERIALALALQKVDPATWDVQIDAATGRATVNHRPRPARP